MENNYAPIIRRKSNGGKSLLDIFKGMTNESKTPTKRKSAPKPVENRKLVVVPLGTKGAVLKNGGRG